MELHEVTVLTLESDGRRVNLELGVFDSEEKAYEAYRDWNANDRKVLTKVLAWSSRRITVNERVCRAICVR